VIKFLNVQRRTPNAQLPIQKVNHWTLDVERSAFSS
jgi:hypothetical protein